MACQRSTNPIIAKQTLLHPREWSSSQLQNKFAGGAAPGQCLSLLDTLDPYVRAKVRNSIGGQLL